MDEEFSLSRELLPEELTSQWDVGNEQNWLKKRKSRDPNSFLNVKQFLSVELPRRSPSDESCKSTTDDNELLANNQIPESPDLLDHRLSYVVKNTSVFPKTPENERTLLENISPPSAYNINITLSKTPGSSASFSQTTRRRIANLVESRVFGTPSKIINPTQKALDETNEHDLDAIDKVFECPVPSSSNESFVLIPADRRSEMNNVPQDDPTNADHTILACGDHSLESPSCLRAVNRFLNETVDQIEEAVVDEIPHKMKVEVEPNNVGSTFVLEKSWSTVLENRVANETPAMTNNSTNNNSNVILNDECLCSHDEEARLGPNHCSTPRLKAHSALRGNQEANLSKISPILEPDVAPHHGCLLRRDTFVVENSRGFEYINKIDDMAKENCRILGSVESQVNNPKADSISRQVAFKDLKKPLPSHLRKPTSRISLSGSNITRKTGGSTSSLNLDDLKVSKCRPTRLPRISNLVSQGPKSPLGSRPSCIRKPALTHISSISKMSQETTSQPSSSRIPKLPPKTVEKPLGGSS